jgi:hypothetical protein
VPEPATDHFATEVAAREVAQRCRASRVPVRSLPRDTAAAWQTSPLYGALLQRAFEPAVKAAEHQRGYLFESPVRDARAS